MNKKYFLIAILLLALTLRVWGLERGDTLNDEVFYAFRGLGMLDFDEAEMQTTPLEWYDPNIPWWTSLSFHDHPPLVFLTQHYFLKIFGETNFALRLPSALLGTISVYLLYLLGKRLFSENAGLFSAAFLAVTLNHVFISRVGMQESYVIFFLLSGSLFFLKSLEKENYLFLAGAALGLGVLAKYNTLILAPIFAAYLLFFKRNYFLKWKLWASLALSLLITAPVIIYNVMLYRNAGHLDFQLSYIFGEHPAVWKIAPGKEIGSLADRIKNFLPRLIGSHSWTFLLLSAASLLSGIFALCRSFRRSAEKYAFLFIASFFLLILLLLIGPAYRFLAMLTPFMALAVGKMFDAVLIWLKTGRRELYYAGIAALILLLSFETAYAINNQIIYYPVGPSPWFASKIRFENYNWGNNELESFLRQELEGKMPALTFDVQYQFLEKLREEALKEERGKKLTPYPLLIVYGGNIDDGVKLWVLDRRFIYHAWPVIKLEDFFKFREEKGTDFFTRAGFTYYDIIVPTNFAPTPEFRGFVRTLPKQSIFNKRGDEVFVIYKIAP